MSVFPGSVAMGEIRATNSSRRGTYICCWGCPQRSRLACLGHRLQASPWRSLREHTPTHTPTHTQGAIRVCRLSDCFAGRAPLPFAGFGNGRAQDEMLERGQKRTECKMEKERLIADTQLTCKSSFAFYRVAAPSRSGIEKTIALELAPDPFAAGALNELGRRASVRSQRRSRWSTSFELAG